VGGGVGAGLWRGEAPASMKKSEALQAATPECGNSEMEARVQLVRGGDGEIPCIVSGVDAPLSPASSLIHDQIPRSGSGHRSVNRGRCAQRADSRKKGSRRAEASVRSSMSRMTNGQHEGHPGSTRGFGTVTARREGSPEDRAGGGGGGGGYRPPVFFAASHPRTFFFVGFLLSAGGDVLTRVPTTCRRSVASPDRSISTKPRIDVADEPRRLWRP